MNDRIETAYRAWLEKHPLKYGRAGRDAFYAGYRAAVPTEPTWDTMPTADKLEHCESCWGCDVCMGGRAWGACTSCGADPKEALPPEGLSRCCGSYVSMREAS